MEQELVKKESVFKKPWVQSVTSMVCIFGVLGGFLLWQIKKGEVSIEDSYLDAPVVTISSQVAGTLNALYVHEGQYVEAHSQIALVGSSIITTQEPGIVVTAPSVLGAYFTPGQMIVSLVENNKMKLRGSIEETKGLKEIIPGQTVSFTVDTFGSKKYEGIVDTVSATSQDTGVVFSISDKRPVKRFIVTVRFDTTKYPELKNGMSAKMIINTR